MNQAIKLQRKRFSSEVAVAAFIGASALRRVAVAAVLLAVARERGIAVAATTSPEELLQQLKPLLLFEGRPRSARWS